MGPARELALAFRERHGLKGAPTDRQIDRLLRAAGLEVERRWPFVGRVREVYAAGTLAIGRGQPPEWVRWLKCHGLGHHLLHRGNHLYAGDGIHMWQQQEIEAEMFAGTILLEGVEGAGPSLRRLAELARVPIECVHSWQAVQIRIYEERGRL